MALNQKSGRGWRQGWLGSGQALGRCVSRPLVPHGRPLGGVSIVPVSETSYRPVKGKGLSKQLIVSAIYTLAPKASRAPSPDPQKE